MAEELPTPPPEPIFLDADTALARIQAIVANARTIWFALLGFLAFIGLTLVSVRDIDFFSVAATTDLPIVGIAIPTDTFFWSAAWLAAVLHTYFHLYLVKLWDVLAEAPPEIGGARDARRWEIRFGVLTEAQRESAGAPLGDRVFPWLVVDWALRRRPDHPTTPRPMDWLAGAVTWLVIWLATPLMLAAFWWRSMPAHDARLTLAIGAALLLSLFATLRGWRRARLRLSNPGLHDTRAFWRDRGVLGGLRRGLESLAVLVLWLLMLHAVPAVALVSLAGAGWHHLPAWVDRPASQLWQDHARDRWRTIAPLLTVDRLSLRLREPLLTVDWLSSYRHEPPLVIARLIDAEIAERPPDWRDFDVARARFEIAWCRDENVPLRACRKRELLDKENTRRAWCTTVGIAPGECPAQFASIDNALETAWLIERAAYFANITGPDLSGRDLRSARATHAFLAAVKLSDARLEGADLRFARLEGANLSDASLDGADLYGARLGGADLRDAKLRGTILREARLEAAWLHGAWLMGADLRDAQLSAADLRDARLEGANLSDAGLEGVNLGGARLDGANLRGARLDGANLTQAKFQFTTWAGATLAAAAVHGSDFTGSWELTQKQLAEVIGDENTILPRDAETGEQLYVCTCWAEPPPTLDGLLRPWPEDQHDDLRRHLLCPPNVTPKRTGWLLNPEPDVDCGD